PGPSVGCRSYDRLPPEQQRTCQTQVAVTAEKSSTNACARAPARPRSKTAGAVCRKTGARRGR
ncbi:MAG TPA: hypothetical protein VKJ47_06555, partial [Candidatus Binatia bacterium]|nr:hypothetical protein [Candidatus Binatia bacterium]